MAEDIHIRLDHPTTIRRGLLESALHSSEFLQTIQKIQGMEHERLALNTHFQRAMSDVTMLMGQFMKVVPQLPQEFIQRQHAALHDRIIQHPQLKTARMAQHGDAHIQVKEQTPATFLSPLELEMEELKKKIQSLNI